MANFNNEHWVPAIDKNNLDNSYAYPIYIYDGEYSKFLIENLYSLRHLVCDIDPDNSFVINKRQDDGIRYIKVDTMYNDGSIIICAHEDEEKEFEFIKSETQNIKHIELLIHDKELRAVYNPSIFFEGDEIYINPRDMHILSMYKPSFIKSLIISATTDKVIENRSRRRIK